VHPERTRMLRRLAIFLRHMCPRPIKGPNLYAAGVLAPTRGGRPGCRATHVSKPPPTPQVHNDMHLASRQSRPTNKGDRVNRVGHASVRTTTRDPTRRLDRNVRSLFGCVSREPGHVQPRHPMAVGRVQCAMFGWFGVELEPASEAPALATQGRPTAGAPIPGPAAGHNSGGHNQVGV